MVSTTARNTKDIQRDLDALHDDLANLAKKVGGILSDKGNSAWQQAMSGIEDTVTHVEKKAREAGGDMTGAINEALKTKPLTTLAVAIGIGFLFGAIWRR